MQVINLIKMSIFLVLTRVFILSLMVFLGGYGSTYASVKTVALIGQFHLSPGQTTKDIEASKLLPQFTNQKAIYLVLNEFITKKNLKVVLAEGCEGEINKDFKTVFNGWSYQDLSNFLKNDRNNNYGDILTSVPLKLEVKFKNKLKTLCGDDLDLIKKHQKIQSDIRGYFSFYSKFRSLSKGSKIFKNYLDALEESESKKINNPLEFTREKVLFNLKKEEEALRERNLSFIKKLKKIKSASVAIVIGNRHLPELKELIEKEGIKTILYKEIQDTIPKEDYVKKLKMLLK